MRFEGQEKVTRLSAHGQSSFALTESGELYAWGDNSSGQLTFTGCTTVLVPTLVQFKFPSPLEDIACGYSHVIGLTRDGQVFAWGRNDTCKLARPVLLGMSHTPLLVSLPEKISQIFVGSGASYALTNKGALYGWGWNSYGNVGNGSIDSCETPYRIFKSGVVNVACGWAHAVALFENGKVKGWGYNAYSQLGLGGTTNACKPKRIKIPQLDIRCMFCTCYSSAFITSSGDFYFAGQILKDQHPKFAKYSDKKYALPNLVGWEEIFCWLFLGRTDPNSKFYLLPQEVLFNFALLFFGRHQ
jgi:alpha-tubulin suppressor-like RCC1 family protein